MTSWWHVIRCQSGREAACVDLLQSWGYDRGWFPTEKRERRQRGKTRFYRAPVVTGYVFVPAMWVDVYQINAHDGKLWMKVLAPLGEPVKLTNEDMGQMKKVPERLEQFAAEARAQEEAERLAKLPQVGQIARIIDGIFAGNEGEVLDVGETEVTIEAQPPFKHYRVPRELVERVA